MVSLLTRLATGVVAVACRVPTPGRVLVGLAVVVLLPLVAYGCGEGGQSPDSSETELRPWQDPLAGEGPNYTASTSGHPRMPCRPDWWGDENYGPDLYEHFIHWSPDGSHLVFDADNTIWTLDADGAELLELAEVDPEGLDFGFYADMSPDGPQIVYSTCEYPDDGYEIAAVRVDGTDKRRLTEDGYFDHYPVWSPDGRRIAFVSHRLAADLKAREDRDYSYLRGFGTQPDVYPVFRYKEQRKAKLAILRVEKNLADRLLDVVLRRGDVSWLEETSRLALAPPVWSPDSERLAFIVNEGEPRGYWHDGKSAYRYTRVLHTVRGDGSRLTRIGETTALPTWSPDGDELAGRDELAYATVDGDVPALYAVRPDGTGRRLIWSGGADEGFAPISQVLWSPDGSEILFFSNESYLVRPDGGGLRRLGIPRHVPDARAAWSPGRVEDSHLLSVPADRHRVARWGGVARPRGGSQHRDPAAEARPNPPEASPPRGDLRALDPPLTIALDQLDCSAPVTYVYGSWLEHCRPKGEDGS